MIITLLLIVSLVMAAAPFVFKQVRHISTAAIVLSTVVFAAAAYAASPILFGHMREVTEGWWYLDALSALMLLLIAFVQWTGTIASKPYIEEEAHEGVVDLADARRYFSLLGLFILSMLAAVVVNNFGLMWVAIEATTLATALLVAFYRKPGSLEAGWKYLILCSTGISLGLIGLLCVFYAASVQGGGHGLETLDWTHLVGIAAHLPATLMSVAFTFILIGYGTKVGLVPMHAWLPDAHSRAPSPISGMLSGVLLNAALYAILRYKSLVDGSLGSSEWTGGLLLWFGVLSVAVPAAFILVQRDYKRLLAYSSIEHMGLMTFAIGLGGIGVAASIVHMIGHALTKSMLFFGAGNILLKFQSTKFENVSGVVRVLPYTSGFFLFGLLALLAVPPSPLFLSELVIIAAGITSHPVALAIVLAALTVVLAGFIQSFVPMLFSREHAAGSETDVSHGGEKFGLSHFALTLHAVLIVFVGVALWTLPGQFFITNILAVIA